MTKCPACETESKPGTRFCPKCGSDLSLVPPIYDDPDSDAKSKAMLFYALAGMMGFFAFGFLLPGLLAESGFLFVSLALIIVAIIFFLIGRGIVKKERSRIEHLRKEWAVHGRCEYCGMQNAPGNQKCVSCGAPLENRVQ
ncbi:MAG: zinc-ribbon domain-containing protein [Methanomassiliicoccales archaeon]|jgi:predicted amidophosphoribosyltransferase